MDEILRIDGIDYEFVKAAQFRCANCYRVTLTGLCGCTIPDPVYVSDVLVGVPIDNVIHPKEGDD